MARSVDELRSELNAMEERDFDLSNPNADGIERLRAICGELTGRPAEVVAPMLLSFIERFVEPARIDARCDLGTPGPLVHTLETLPGYGPWLLESIRRRPAPLSLWMLNRILNVLPDGEDYNEHLALLRSVTERSDLSSLVVAEAAEFFELQTANRREGSG